MRRRKQGLENELKSSRFEPSEEFVRTMSGKIPARRRVRVGSGALLRPTLALLATGVLVVAVVALGGTAARPTTPLRAHLSPFLAAALTYCTTPVTINQASTQADPTTSQPIHFTVDFGQPVTGFTPSDVQSGGTAGGTRTVVVSGGTQVYDVAISGLTTAGTVTASIPANAATDLGATCATPASTSTDNTVTWSVFRITTYTEDGGSTNSTFSGDGAVTGTNVVVTVCAVNSFPCSAGNTLHVFGGVLPSSAGTWTTGKDKLDKGAHFAQAAQGANVTPPFSFTVN